jgi:transcriptional regulator with XRE-family HTH domain
MDDLQVGRTLRALRLRRGLRQRDVAAASQVSQQLISLVERGHASSLSLRVLRRVAEVLDLRLALRGEWRGGELDRLLDADHAALQAASRRWLERRAWEVAVEVTFSRYGERGSIDILAFHPPSGALAVVEIKTVVADLQSLLRGMDAKTRLGPGIARERGWHPRWSVPCLVLAEGTTNRRRVQAAAPLLHRFGIRGPAARAWFRDPHAAGGLLVFLSPPSTNRGSGRRAGRQRLRLSRSQTSTTASTDGRHAQPNRA